MQGHQKFKQIFMSSMRSDRQHNQLRNMACSFLPEILVDKKKHFWWKFDEKWWK